LLTESLITHAATELRRMFADPEQELALASVLLAAGLVVVSSFVKTMIPLRWLAVGSNVGFLGYGVLHPSLPMLLLHALLLPINVYRAIEMVQLTRRVTAVAGGGERVPEEDVLSLWLRPYMRSAKMKAGSVLFRRGDEADRLYLLAAGKVELVEIGVVLQAGTIFGEIAFFSPDRQRKLTARCADDCTVLSIDESTVRQLYYQNPAFGFELISLVAGRLSADIERLQRQLAEAQARTAPAVQGATAA
jgi:CRP-like cAMP-binding protein